MRSSSYDYLNQLSEKKLKEEFEKAVNTVQKSAPCSASRTQALILMELIIELLVKRL